ncbi:hypothetical protein LI90_4253 [Carbonactinospora thermoautotrophica]|uniref:Uncharacterized protein n=1 Tax=Carbonactinospora thermoautotrophica TaxID=1469144 RepID=A0A132N0S0_9ACTN|nr:hypothetical protein [Carbonactinospora thermoautotrophica]KWX03202.1 hypothetical protein LI90_4253 [Carbonactinospora thermoautotrophica]
MALLHRRGVIDDYALRAAKHVSWFANRRDGRLPDDVELAGTYAAAHHVSTRTWRTDRRRLVDAGLLVLVQAAAAGRRARYALAIPPWIRDDPGDLPTELALQLDLITDEDLYGPRPCTRADRPPPVPEDVDQPQPETDSQDNERGAEPGLWMTSSVSISIEGSSPLSAPVAVGGARASAPRGQGEISSQEKARLEAAAWRVLRRARPWWARQRGRDRVLDLDAQRRLVPLLVEALRRTTEAELVEEITVQTRSADSLAGVVAHRLWRLVQSRLPFDQRPVEPSPELRAKAAAVRARRAVLTAAANNPELQRRRAAARAAAYQALHAALDARHTQPQAPATAQATGGWLREPEEAFRAHLAELGIALDPDEQRRAARAAEARRIHAAALARARRERAARHAATE